MKTIQLTQGYEAIVDDNDYDGLMQFKWCAHKNSTGHCVYAKRGIRYRKEDGSVSTKIVFMHNQIMGTRDGYEVDHVSRDSLDNRRANLRWATRKENACNTGRKPGKSGYYGVAVTPSGFVASYGSGKRWKYVGFYKTAEEAARAYDSAVSLDRGGFARLNFQPSKGES